MIKVSKVYLGLRLEAGRFKFSLLWPVASTLAGALTATAEFTAVLPSWYLISLISGAMLFKHLSISWWYLAAIQSRLKALGTPTIIKSGPLSRIEVFLNQVLKLALLKDISKLPKIA